MKIISLLQPFATLVVIGQKKIETRSWNTKFRGPLLIHASQKFTNELHDICIFDPFYSELLSTDYFDETKPACGLPTGAIIGKVNLVATSILVSPYGLKNGGNDGIFFNDKGAMFTEKELAFGDYSDGRYGWLLSDPEEFKKPIPAKGQLGFWDYEILKETIK